MADGGPATTTSPAASGSDILFAGESGADHLNGGAGDDGLIGRGGGPETMEGGPGNDNIVSDNPCTATATSAGRAGPTRRASDT